MQIIGIYNMFRGEFFLWISGVMGEHAGSGYLWERFNPQRARKNVLNEGFLGRVDTILSRATLVAFMYSHIDEAIESRG